MIDEHGLERLDEVENPLLAPLSDIEIDLLATIQQPIRSGKATDVVSWPTWDYVSRTVEEKHPDIRADDLWESLPSIARCDARGGSYGLVWRNGSGTGLIQPGETVGLTIAGLLQYDVLRHRQPAFANHIGWLVARFKAQEQGLPREWNQAVEARLDLRGEASDFLDARPPERPFRITTVALGEILRFEFFPLAAPSTNHNYDINIGLGRFRHLNGVSDDESSAASYVRAIWKLSSTGQDPQRHVSPLPLIQTLDYLAYVLQDDPMWPTKERMTAAPDLQSAAALGLPVKDEAEFASRMSGLWNVINQLKIPRASEGDLRREDFDPKTAGSLNFLVVWLVNRLGKQTYSHILAPAIADIQAARLVRNEGAHQSDSARRRAIKARQRLGLPAVLADWPTAWTVITGRIAGAFDLIRETVQTTPPPP